MKIKINKIKRYMITILIVFMAGLPFTQAQNTVNAAEQSFGEPKELTGDNIGFVNGSFEEPVYTDPNGLKPYENATGYNRQYFLAPDVPGWETVVVNSEHVGLPYFNAIQIQNYNAIAKLGRPDIYDAPGGMAAEGNQYVELNCEYPSRLYQVCNTTPGQKIYWELYHSAGNYSYYADLGIYPDTSSDIMNVYMYGGSDGTIAPPANSLQQISQTAIRDGWKYYNGVYQVGSDDETTILAFEAVSSYSGNPKYGNNLDGIRVFTPSFLALNKMVTTSQGTTSGDDDLNWTMAGETVTYTIIVENLGEADSSRTVLTDGIADGMELILDSVTIDGNPAGGLAAYDSDLGILRINLGKGATVGGAADNGGSLTQNQKVEIAYQVKVTGDSKNGGDLLRSQAQITYNDKGFEVWNSGDEVNYSNIVSLCLKQSFITGTIWNDYLADGLRDADITVELPLVGVNVRLLTMDGNQAQNFAGEDLITATDENGFYSFEDMRPGIYQVEADISGYLVTRKQTNSDVGNKAERSAALAMIKNIDISAPFGSGNDVNRSDYQNIGVLSMSQIKPPMIAVQPEIKIPQGTALDLMSLVKEAVDSLDGDLTSQVIILSDDGFDYQTAGIYQVEYAVQNIAGLTATASSTVVVDAPPILQSFDINIQRKQKIDILSLIKTAYDKEDGDLTAQVAVVDDGGLDIFVTGEYHITFRVTDSIGNEAESVSVVTIDDLYPELEVNKVLRYSDAMDEEQFLAMAIVSVWDRESDVTITNNYKEILQSKTFGDYVVRISVTDDYEQTVFKDVVLVPEVEAPEIYFAKGGGHAVYLIGTEVSYNELMNDLKVYARDWTGKELKEFYLYKSEVDWNQTGDYIVTLGVEDANGNRSSIEGTVSIIENTYINRLLSPQTGDHHNWVFWLLILALTGTVILSINYKNKNIRK